MRIELADQVVAFVKALSPEPRRRVRLALRHLQKNQGDIRALDGPLGGYYRLRIGPYRIVFTQTAKVSETPCIRCIFAERRDMIYEIFSDMLKQRLLDDK